MPKGVPQATGQETARYLVMQVLSVCLPFSSFSHDKPRCSNTQAVLCPVVRTIFREDWEQATEWASRSAEEPCRVAQSCAAKLGDGSSHSDASRVVLWHWGMQLGTRRARPFKGFSSSNRSSGNLYHKVASHN